jgi:caffeoyl-CoA O-methyltransferase
MTRELEKYLADHTSPEDPVLEELYRQTHIRFVNPNMVTGHLQGKFLEMISKMINPFYILEIGTFTGYSAICLSKGLKEGGKLITIEINDELTSFSHSYFCKAGVEDRIIQLTGSAVSIIPELDHIFDLVFIDGDKREYIGYFNAVFEKVKTGGFILADNVLWGEKVLVKDSADQQTAGMIAFNDYIINHQGIETVILPVRDGVTLIRKK